MRLSGSQRRERHDKVVQQNHRLERALEKAQNEAIFEKDDVARFKEKNKKLSKEITTLMLLLNNSKGSKEALEKHISDNAALSGSPRTSSSGHPLPADKGKLKLRQKTKKAIEKQDNLTSDIHDGDNNLNESV